MREHFSAARRAVFSFVLLFVADLFGFWEHTFTRGLDGCLSHIELLRQVAFLRALKRSLHCTSLRLASDVLSPYSLCSSASNMSFVSVVLRTFVYVIYFHQLGYNVAFMTFCATLHLENQQVYFDL